MNIATTGIAAAILLGLLGATPVQSNNRGLKVSPAHLKFGKVRAGQISVAKAVTLSNRADVAVSIQSVVTSGPFLVSSSNCGSQVPAKPATCSILVKFNPKYAGNAKITTPHGKLTISDDSAASPQVVTLMGIALRAETTPTMTPTPTATPTPTLTAGILVTGNNGNPEVTIYPLGSTGDVRPSATIEGADTGLNAPTGIAVDSKGNIYVANDGSSDGGTDSITVYPPGSNGDVVPTAVIEGNHTGLITPTGVAVDSIGNIYVANCGEFCGGGSVNPSVTVYPTGSHGNASPSVTISGNNTGLDYSEGIAVDSSRNIYVANFGSGVTVYPAGSNGNVPPSFTVGGGRAVAISDSTGEIYVADYNLGEGIVYVYPSSGGGPIGILNGANTGLCGIVGIALDPIGNIYTLNDAVYACAALDRVNVYPPGSNGDIAPIATIEGNNTGFQFLPVGGIAIGPVAP